MRIDTGKTIKLKDYQAPAYDIETVDLDVILAPDKTGIVAKIVFRRMPDTAAGTPLLLDGDELRFKSAKLDGEVLGNNSYNVDENAFELPVPPDKERFELEISTESSPSTNTKLMGLFQSNGIYCTQCEAEGFRRITYFLDRPDVLATYTTRIEGSKTDAPRLLGNGNLIKQGELANGRHFAVWHDPHPKPSYLFALVGGDLDCIKDQFTTLSGRRVALGIYVEKGKGDRALYAMDALKRSMKWDEEAFGREYDLDIFNIVAVSDFNMGAMENKGLNVFNDKYVLADPNTATDTDYANIEAIIAHEYFHNWTGNRITCRDWFQLCLKEGLTVYRDQEFSSDQRSRAVIRIAEVRQLMAHQFPEDGGPLAHPVRPESYKEINNFYTATVYEKGAELVRMIATIVGRDGFRKGMDLYFERHDGEAARVEDFLSAFEDANDVDLGQFSLWYSQSGTPHLTVSAQYDKSRKTCSLEIEQSLAPTPGQSRKKLMHIPVRFSLIGKNGRDIPLTACEGGRVEGEVIHLTRRNTKLTFKGIGERPRISLLRNFSAPVIVNFNQSKIDLAFLARHDSDLFNRWQALQNLTMQSLLAGTRAAQKGTLARADKNLLDIFCEISRDESLEPAFRALALSLPNEAEIGRAVGKNIEPDAIFSARQSLLKSLGEAFGGSIISQVNALETPGSYSPAAEPAGKRALKNVLLSLAISAENEEAQQITRRQFKHANNMSDRMAALTILAHNVDDTKSADEALDEFYAMYSEDPLVIDKWLMVQATIPGKDTLRRVRELIRHPAFSLTNPNRARSLIGSFVAGNQTGFNRADGEAYNWFAAILLQLDAINPQVAARLLTAMRSWRMLEKSRRQKARAALENIASHELSNDVRDIIDRTLS